MTQREEDQPSEIEKQNSGDAGLAEKLEADEDKTREVLLSALTQFSGPLPPPEILESYDRIVPGSAKEMHDLVIERARQIMTIEQTNAQAIVEDGEAERAQFRRGQWLTFVLALLLIACGTVSILMGHDWAGATIVTTTLGSLVLAFLWGKRSEGNKGETRDEAEAD